MTHKLRFVSVTEWTLETTADQSEIEKAKRNIIDILKRETPESSSWATRTRMTVEEMKA